MREKERKEKMWEGKRNNDSKKGPQSCTIENIRGLPHPEKSPLYSQSSRLLYRYIKDTEHNLETQLPKSPG